MPLITLTTDYGLKDHFAGALKGKLFKAYSEVQLVDLTHQIQPFSGIEAAYVLQAAHADFPEDTVHLIGVNSGFSEQNLPLIFRWNQQYFVGADHEIFGLLTLQNPPEALYRITLDVPEKKTDMDVLVQVAVHLAKGGNPLQLAQLHTQPIAVRTSASNSNAQDDEITGSFIHFDEMGNAISNIKRADFERLHQQRSFEVIVPQNSRHRIADRPRKLSRIYNSYAALNQSRENSSVDQPSLDGTFFALFNEAGYLEIGIFRGIPGHFGTARDLLGIKHNDVIKIVFN